MELEPVNELEDVPIDQNDPSKIIKIGWNINKKLQEELIRFIEHLLDVFAWTHANMVGIDPTVICRAVNIDPNVFLIRQKRILLDQELYNALHEEVKKLKDNGFIKEIYYP